VSYRTDNDEGSRVYSDTSARSNAQAVTLYKEQWLRILASAPEIEAFIRENDSKLKTKE
jgi:hypothetical protein